jgi:phosphate acetyltransferase
MKIKSIYITSNDTLSGKLVVAIPLMQLLKSKFHKVAFFKPIVESKQQKDNDIDFMLKHFKMKQKYKEAYGFTKYEVEKLLSNDKIQTIYQTLLEKIKILENEYDFVLIEGIDHKIVQSIDQFDINLKIAKHFNSSIINVINCDKKSNKYIIDRLKIEYDHIKNSKANHIISFVNRVDIKNLSKLNMQIDKLELPIKIFALPHEQILNYATVAQIRKDLKLKKLFGTKSNMQKLIFQHKVSAMHLENLLSYIEVNDLLIVPWDRSDIILGIIPSIFSKKFPTISAILLTGNTKPHKQVYDVLNGLEKLRIPILSTDDKTYETAVKVSQVKPIITPKDKNKIAIIKGLFTKYIDEQYLNQIISNAQTSNIITPLMFEYSLFQKAKESKKTIVLPESFDARVLEAVQSLLHSDVVDIILIGNVSKIKYKAEVLGVDISNAKIIDPMSSKYTQKFAKEFYELRKHKGQTYEKSLELMQTDVNYFATMLVYFDYANGMVSGATHTTASTVRPALQIIKTKKDISIVSSVFFMCLDTKVMLFSDCAIVQDPTATELSHIALSTVNTANSFDIDPNVAMLSYSTGDSGSGKDVQKVIEATNLVKQKNKNIKIEGPIQYDAATSKVIAKQKLPNSKIAGEANVLIFPDLNTGNNTYKAVRSSANAVAIGPILQGLNKPINDLSRGCEVRDIINTVIITAIQANEGI